MPIDAQCSHCHKKYRLKDELAGRAVRCAACQKSFVPGTGAATVKAPPAKAPVPAAAPTRPPAPRPPATPKAPRSPVRSPRPATAPDDGFEERPRSRRDRDEDDRRDRGYRDDYDDDRPRSRRRDEDEEDDRRFDREEKKDSAGLVIGLAVGGVLLLAGLGVGGYFLFSSSGGGGGGGGGLTQGGGKTEVDLEGLLNGGGDIVKDGGGRGLLAKGGDRGPVPIKPTLVPVGGKTFEVSKYFVPAKTNEVLALRGSFLIPGKTKPRVERYDLGSLSKAGSAEVDVTNAWGAYAVSPDGKTLAISKSPTGFGGLELVLVNVADGKIINAGWKPTYQRGGGGGIQFRAEGAKAFPLDATRWLVMYDDEALALWTVTGSEASRKELRAGRGQKRFPLGQAALSRDGKTLVMWNGKGFTVLDPETGKVRSQTSEIAAPPAGERTECHKVHLSPDGTNVIAELLTMGRSRNVRSYARWDLKAGGAPTPFKGVENSLMAQWWGNRHVLTFGSRDFSAHGYLVEAATGKVLCKYTQKGGPGMPQSEDGHLWFVTSNKLDMSEAVLVRVPFPEGEVKALAGQTDGPFDKLPLMEISTDGAKVK